MIVSSGGDYGQLRVYYQTSELDLLSEVYTGDGDVFSYFFEPLRGKLVVSPVAGTRWHVDDQPDPLLVRMLAIMFISY